MSALLLAGLVLAVQAQGATGPTPTSAAPTAAFAVAPLRDAELADVRGAGLARYPLRLEAEAHAAFFRQSVADTSRVVLDNWWAQTGAALIAANMLASAR